MNKRSYIFLFFITISNFLLYPQSATDPVLAIINNTPVYKSDFEYSFHKAITGSKGKIPNIHDFLNTFINIKLNVEEAKSEGLDKKQNFISEYSVYRGEIEKPYMTDSVSPLIVGKSIYNKLKQNVKINTLFVKLPQGNILPKDTIAAFDKIYLIKKSVNKTKNDSFEKLITKYTDNESKSPQTRWQTAFSNPYSFDKAMFETRLNTISNPVRTLYGYSLIKVHAKRPDPGQVNIAHILFRYPQEHPTKREKDSVVNLSYRVYRQLLKGADFNKLCQEYSFDKATSSQGGNLGWFGINRPFPEQFESVIFNLKKTGNISKPIQAEYGYHIFKVLDKMDFPSWESVKDIIIKSIPESDYNNLLVDEKIKKLSSENQYLLDNKSYQSLIQSANIYHPSDTLFFKNIEPIKSKTLLTVEDVNYTIDDFIFFLEKNPTSNYFLSTDIIYHKTRDFILDRLIEAKRIGLYTKYPNLKHLAQEFHDGILYFDIMNDKIWTKSQGSKKELNDIFKKNKAKYKWESPKYKGYVIHVRNKSIVNQVKSFAKSNSKKNNFQQLLSEKFNTDSVTTNVIAEKGLWGKGDNAYIDQAIFNVNSNKEFVGFPEFIVEGKLMRKPESLEDALGLVVSDYQEQLEQQWAQYLLKKYKVEINKDVLESIK